jgi:hypothetical protein
VTTILRSLIIPGEGDTTVDKLHGSPIQLDAVHRTADAEPAWNSRFAIGTVDSTIREVEVDQEPNKVASRRSDYFLRHVRPGSGDLESAA